MANILEVFDYNQHFVAMMNIINAARLNPPESGHKHHIIPRCWFKMNNLPVDNSKDNLVLLSVEDHIKVHRLSILCAATPQLKGRMALAVHRLLKGKKDTMVSYNMSGINNPMYGVPRSKEIRDKISATKKARMNDELRKKISEAKKGNNNPNYGKHLSEDTKRNIGKSLKGVPKSEFGDKFKEHYGNTHSDNFNLYHKEYRWYTRHNHKCRWEL